jgi:hypothetical protein
MNVSDTTGDAAKVYVAAYATLSGSARVERSIEMADEVRQVTLAGIRYRHPEFTEDEIHREWLRILHGDALAELLA